MSRRSRPKKTQARRRTIPKVDYRRSKGTRNAYFTGPCKHCGKTHDLPLDVGECPKSDAAHKKAVQRILRRVRREAR